MENYLKPTSNGRRIVFPKDFADIAAFTTTCDWCVYNRLFVSRTAEWGEMEEGVLDISTYYYEANPASVLLDNINAARQTWNYAINEQISNFAQTYPTNLKASSNEALLFMRRYRFANCSCFSCCFKDAYPSSNVQ
jgi:hypothetical protein